jgi:hypothetical protein
MSTRPVSGPSGVPTVLAPPDDVDLPPPAVADGVDTQVAGAAFDEGMGSFQLPRGGMDVSAAALDRIGVHPFSQGAADLSARVSDLASALPGI